MKEYPKSLAEFESWFSSEQACRDYLYRLRWPNGFTCPRCSSLEAWPIGTMLYECSGCHYQLSVVAGTIFQDTHKPLTVWFRAIWWVTGQKNGASALGLKRMLGLGSYRTAWTWLHKLRRAMVRPGRDCLSGIVEVDETFIGGEKPGKRGRGAFGKVLVGIAVEDKGDEGIGRIRLGILPDASVDSLTPFVEERLVEGSTIQTDDWLGYNRLESAGYRHVTMKKTELKLAHLVASLLRRWLLGTHQGKLFMRLLENAVQIEPVTQGQIVQHIRGRKPKTHNIW